LAVLKGRGRGKGDREGMEMKILSVNLTVMRTSFPVNLK
jgi:hypothetical protein